VLCTGSPLVDAEIAFVRVNRARRLSRVLRRACPLRAVDERCRREALRGARSR